MTRTTSFLYYLNKICAVFLVIWICWPWFSQNVGLLWGMLFVIGWTVSAVVIHNKHTIGYDGMLMIFYVLYMAVSYLLTGRTYGEYQLYYYISMAILFFLPYYMARFYFGRNETKFMGTLAIVAIVCMLIGCFTSIYYTSIDENIMKTISQGMDTEFLGYRKAGIGSFGFVYMVLFAVIALLGLLKSKLIESKLWIKLFLVVFCVVGIKCILDSTFTTSILLLFVGVIFVFITVKNTKMTNMVVYFLALIFMIIISRLVGYFLTTIQLESTDITVRLHEIGQLLMGQEGGANTDSRLDYLVKSMNCFFRYPIFGYNFVGSPEVKMGGHCEWMDILGVYGLVGGIPLIATIIMKLKNTRSITKQMNYPYYGILIFIFVIFGFVDPFLRIYHMGFAMFFLVPCIGCIPNVLKKEGSDT